MHQLLFFLFALWTTTISAAIPRGDGSAAHSFASDVRKTVNTPFRASENADSSRFSPGRVWEKVPSHSQEISIGSQRVQELNGYEVERTYDACFRINGVTLRQGAQVIYSVNYGYEGDTLELDTVEWVSGPLQGFKLDEDADARGRLHSLTASKDADELYSVTHGYRGELQSVC